MAASRRSIRNVENLTALTVGLTYQAKNGFFVGGGLSDDDADDRPLARSRRWPTTTTRRGTTGVGRVRIGYHPGVRIYVPPPAAAAPAPPPPPPAARAAAQPDGDGGRATRCTVAAGQTSHGDGDAAWIRSAAR